MAPDQQPGLCIHGMFSGITVDPCSVVVTVVTIVRANHADSLTQKPFLCSEAIPEQLCLCSEGSYILGFEATPMHKVRPSPCSEASASIRSHPRLGSHLHDLKPSSYSEAIPRFGIYALKPSLLMRIVLLFRCVTQSETNHMLLLFWNCILPLYFEIVCA